MPDSGDVAISASAVTAVPQEYTVPDAAQIMPRAVTAIVDGTAAVSSFVPTVEIVAPGGKVVARSITSSTVAAGASAEVSWFPIRDRQTAAATVSPYEVLVTSSPLLRAYYKLDETSGAVMADSGPLGLNGTYSGAPTLGQPPLADGTSVQFHSASSQWGGRTGATGFDATGPQAVAAWIKTGTVPASPMMVFASDDNNFRYCQLRLETNGKVRYIVFDAGNANFATLDSAGAVNDGNRHFIVGTWDSGQRQRVMVDNVVVGSQTTVLVGQSQRVRELDVGARNVFGASNFFDGIIDEAMIFNGLPPDSYFTNVYTQGLLA